MSTYLLISRLMFRLGFVLIVLMTEAYGAAFPDDDDGGYSLRCLPQYGPSKHQYAPSDNFFSMFDESSGFLASFLGSFEAATFVSLWSVDRTIPARIGMLVWQFVENSDENFEPFFRTAVELCMNPSAEKQQQILKSPLAKKAAKLYRVKESHEEAEALYLYGEILYLGFGVKENKKKAAKFLRRAAEIGDMNAQYRYAEMLYFGDGVDPQVNDAATYYFLATEQGHLLSALRYGEILYFGDIGGRPNKREAAVYFERGVGVEGDDDQHAMDIDAAYNLAYMLDRGDGIRIDTAKAIKYYRFAAKGEHVQAQARIAELLEQEEIKSSEEMAFLYERMAKQGDVRAQFRYAKMLYQGDGVPQDKKKARKCLRKVAKKGLPQAQFTVSFLDRHDRTPEMDYSVIDANSTIKVSKWKNDWFPSALSLDGGGIRGLMHAVMLHQVERATNYNIHQIFDITVGTSIGGFVALGLAATTDGISPVVTPEQGIDLFKTKGNTIFNGSCNWFTSKHDPAPLYDITTAHFRDITLRNTLMRVIVPAVDLTSRRPIYFDSFKAVTDPESNYFCRDVAMGTGAAPTYFPAFGMVNVPETTELKVIDGGMATNNPGFIAHAALTSANPDRKSRWCLLSLGTGDMEINPSDIPASDGGKLKWAAAAPKYLMAGGEHTVHDQLVLQRSSKRKYERFQPTLPYIEGSLDNCSGEAIEVLESAALNAHNWDDSEFLRWLAENTAKKFERF